MIHGISSMTKYLNNLRILINCNKNKNNSSRKLIMKALHLRNSNEIFDSLYLSKYWQLMKLNFSILLNLCSFIFFYVLKKSMISFYFISYSIYLPGFWISPKTSITGFKTGLSSSVTWFENLNWVTFFFDFIYYLKLWWNLTFFSFSSKIYQMYITQKFLPDGNIKVFD